MTPGQVSVLQLVTVFKSNVTLFCHECHVAVVVADHEGAAGVGDVERCVPLVPVFGIEEDIVL
jgi:hypothetical protein